MIAEKELHETDKLFRKLIAPSLGSFRLESNIYQHHGPVKVGPVLLPHRSNIHGTAQSSHSITRNLRTPKSTDLPTENREDSFPMIDGGQTTSGAAEYEESFAHSYQTSSGVNIRRQQPRAGTSLSSISSTTKMKQLPLPQVQSSELLRTSSPSPRGKRNVSVCSDRYLGTTRVGGGPPHHQRSKSAAEILQPMSTSMSSSDQVRRFKEERMALLQTRTLRRTTEIMAHRKDRKYHMCGSGVPIRDRYMVDSDEMDRIRQLIQARSTKRGSSPEVSYSGRYGVRVTSGLGTCRTKLTSVSVELQQEPQGNNINSPQITTKTIENERSVAIETPVIEENEESVGMASPPANINEGCDAEDNNLVVIDDTRKNGDDQDQMVEVATDIVEKTDNQEDCKDLHLMDEPTERLETLDEKQQSGREKCLDADQPVEGAITTAVYNIEESPKSESKGDEVVPFTDGTEIGEGTHSEEADVTNETDKKYSGYDDVETQVQNMMPNVRISRTQKKKNGGDAFMTEFETAESTEKDDIQEMFGNLKSSPRGLAVNESLEGKTQEGSAQEDPNQGTPEEPKPPTAEEALLGMIISEDKIAAMEDSLRKIDYLKGGIKNVGHLEESEINLDELSTDNPSLDYGEEVFGKVLNDEELKEVERLRAKKREAMSAKSRKADDSIVTAKKVSQAKSKMSEMYNFISSHQQEAFERKFKELDIDGNGLITLQELFKKMYRGRENKETGRAFMQVFDLNKDQTIDQQEFVIVAALNDKLSGKVTETADAPLELDLEKLSQSITSYKRKLALSLHWEQEGNMETEVSSCHDNGQDSTDEK